MSLCSIPEIQSWVLYTPTQQAPEYDSSLPSSMKLMVVTIMNLLIYSERKSLSDVGVSSLFFLLLSCFIRKSTLYFIEGQPLSLPWPFLCPAYAVVCLLQSHELPVPDFLKAWFLALSWFIPSQMHFVGQEVEIKIHPSRCSKATDGYCLPPTPWLW